jgi:hypothetical protein
MEKLAIDVQPVSFANPVGFGAEKNRPATDAVPTTDN